MMIQGREVLKQYPNLRDEDLFAWCKAGRLVPFRKGGEFAGRDPKSPLGFRRAFPPGEAERKYDQLCNNYLSLIDCLKSARRSDTELIKTDQDALANRLMKSGRPIELPPLDQFQYNLFRRRQRGAAELFRLFSKIEELEQELSPEKVWENPGLVLSGVFDLLMDSFFCSEDIDKILSSGL